MVKKITGEKSPMSANNVLDTYFLETRARILDIAAFLDRVNRTNSPEEGKADFRYRALMKALGILLESKENRTKGVQLIFSDPSEEPRESAVGLKGAAGAWEGNLP